MKTRKLLKKLCAEYAVSGRENEMSGIITELTEKYAYEIKELPTGTIIAEVGNKKAKRHIMLDAHIDRIGLVVSNGIYLCGDIFLVQHEFEHSQRGFRFRVII